MKVVIAYCSWHHGNTKKLLDAIKQSYDVTLINTRECKQADLSDYDIIGFASGIYGFNFDESVIESAKHNLPSNKRVFLIHTYGVKMDYTREMRKIIAEKSCRLLGVYGCKGFDTFGPLKLIGGIAKGRPDENDIKGAVEFCRRIIESENATQPNDAQMIRPS